MDYYAYTILCYREFETNLLCFIIFFVSLILSETEEKRTNGTPCMRDTKYYARMLILIGWFDRKIFTSNLFGIKKTEYITIDTTNQINTIVSIN